MRIVAAGFECVAEPGDTILSALRRAGRHIQSICGARGMCGTCRVAVSADWLERLIPPAPAETRLLRVLKAAAPNHRLACQTILTPDHDGLCVTPDPPPSRIQLQQESRS